MSSSLGSAGQVGAVSRSLSKLQVSVGHTLGHAGSWAAQPRNPVLSYSIVVRWQTVAKTILRGDTSSYAEKQK